MAGLKRKKKVAIPIIVPGRGTSQTGIVNLFNAAIGKAKIALKTVNRIGPCALPRPYLCARLHIGDTSGTRSRDSYIAIAREQSLRLKKIHSQAKKVADGKHAIVWVRKPTIGIVTPGIGHTPERVSVGRIDQYFRCA